MTRISSELRACFAPSIDAQYRDDSEFPFSSQKEMFPFSSQMEMWNARSPWG